MKIAVCDTCTLVRLFKGNALHCLSNLLEKIYIPEAVKNERAFKKALNHKLTPVRSFQLLILGKEAGLIKSVGSTLRAMEKAGEGIDADLYIEVLKLADEI